MDITAPGKTAPVKPPQGRRRRRRGGFFLRFLGFMFAAAMIVFIAVAGAAAFVLWKVSSELPDYEVLAKYEPPVMTRIHANNGALISEFSRERRIYVPLTAVPACIIDAFISAEDKNFYQHGGLDVQGIIRAVVTNLSQMQSGRRSVGASTITQQVAKNFLLSSDQTVERKLKEAILAIRIERAFTKEQILELYLNEIYLGVGAYGVAAAAQSYWDKALNELTLADCAYLATLPKAPSNYDPFKFADRAVARRNWVIDRVVENGFATKEEGEAAKAQPLGVIKRVTGPKIFGLGVFRRGSAPRDSRPLRRGQALWRRSLGAHHARSEAPGGRAQSSDRRLRRLRSQARRLARSGEAGRNHRRLGPDARRYSGVVRHRAVAACRGARSLQGPSRRRDSPRPHVGRRAREGTRKGCHPVRGSEMGASEARAGGLGGAPGSVTAVLKPGDVIYVSPREPDFAEDGTPKQTPEELKGQWSLAQVPQIGGALVAMDPHSGRVVAISGGFSFAQSQFDRATQARRQPGSSFKPLIYTVALDNGYTPSSIVVDGPICIGQGAGMPQWCPKNYDAGSAAGPSTLRFGIEKSRNLMTVRLARDMGMPVIAEYSRRFGVYDNLMPALSMALGAGETTLLRMVTGYSVLANGGKQVKPSFIDRVQDRYGRTVWRHDERECASCPAREWSGQAEPELVDNRTQVIDPMSAFQMTSIMEGVVQSGTAQRLKVLKRPIAGKTGTTNDYKDAWFVGYTPDLAVGVYIGYDQPVSMGHGETGGSLAAPIVRDFLKEVLKDVPPVPFRAPSRRQARARQPQERHAGEPRR